MADLFNLARMTTATTGTGTITLGSAVSGFLSFADAGVSDGDTVSYAIADGANSENGTGTYTASGTTLSRSVTKSTNSDAAISLSGSAQVFITPRAEDIVPFDGTTATFTAVSTSGAPIALGETAGLTAPSSPNNGDVWHNAFGLFVRNGGSTFQVVFDGSTATFFQPKVQNPAQTFTYQINGSAITANRIVTLPLLTGADTFVMEAFAQTLTNKTIDLTDNTVSATAAELVTAVSDDDPLFAGTADVLTAGFGTTAHGDGTKSSGTYTPDEADGNIQHVTNGGAHTLAPPTNNCTIIVHYTNNASAGAVTTSGFTLVDGDSLTTTDTHEFLMYIVKANDVSHLTVKALQ